MYKIAISDLDGTLLGADHRISQYTKESIERWIQSDRKFVIATGRHYVEAKYLQASLNTQIYLISSNGARVHDRDGNIILKQNLPTDIAQEICQTTFDPAVQINLFTDQNWFANFSVPEIEEMGLDAGWNCQPVNLQELKAEDTIKIFFWAEPELLQPISEQLKARYGKRINLTFSLEKCLEVMDAGANKGEAVKAVLKEKGLNCDQAVAFGDGMNDVEMLNVVGKPMLMANAQTALRNALPDAEFTLSSKEHGVAVKMDKILTGSDND